MRVKVMKGPFAFGMQYHWPGKELDIVPDAVAEVFVKSGAVAPVDVPKRRRRVYRRRDMQAEQTAVMMPETE